MPRAEFTYDLTLDTKPQLHKLRADFKFFDITIGTNNFGVSEGWRMWVGGLTARVASSSRISVIKHDMRRQKAKH